jgi:AraC-like DNA-binding protein
MRHLTIDQLLEQIEGDIQRAGSQKALAERLNLSEQYLCDVLKRRRAPGPKVLSSYGLRAVTNYVKDKEPKK